MDKTIGLPLPLDRKIYLYDQIEQKVIEKVSKSIITINENDRFLEKLYRLYGVEYKPAPIELYIDSYGGMVYQTFGLISLIETSVTPIHTICTGTAMSCGILLLIAGHKRHCYERSTIMLHSISTFFEGQVQDIKEELAETERLQEIVTKLVVEKTKIPLKTVKAVETGKKDWYMTPSQAKKFKIIDEIL